MTRFAFDDSEPPKSTSRKSHSSTFTASKHANTTDFRSSLARKPTSKLAPGQSPGRTPLAASKRPGQAPFRSSTVGRDLFGTHTPKPTRSFAPNLPASAMKSPAGVRKMVSQKTSGGMASASSTDLFKMRIPSPPPELSGEKLAKQVPQDANRTSSVYADEFLAHLCPPEFDDDQRRQFFCVLDLRRLKYAANEIFTRKDWKINIMNFAKEYEKSRGMIMLRYGLYEFKNVKPSDDVMKQWRAKHNLPEPEEPTGPKTNGVGTASTKGTTTSTKRKADDDLRSKDSALTTSSTNINKRRATETEKDETTVPAGTFNKNKRKADENADMDENQPSKLQKSTATPKPKSAFASIVDKVQSGTGATPSKPFGASVPGQYSAFGKRKPSDEVPQSDKASSLFAPAADDGLLKPKSDLFGKQVNGGASAGSILSGHKIGSAPAFAPGNLFGHLSESSAQNSADEDSESASEEETDSQDVAPSAPASRGINTPPIQPTSSLFSKPTAANNPFGSAPASGTSTPRGGLFDRVTRGSDGQPLRASQGDDNESSTEKPKKPENYTWSPDKPISFGQSTTSLFSNKPTAPAPTASSSLFAAKPSEQTSGASSTKPSVSFGNQPTHSKDDKPAEASDDSKEKASAQSILSKPPDSETSKPASIFATSKPATPQAGSIFSAPKPATTSAASIFDTPSATTGSQSGEKEKPKEAVPPTTALSQTSSLFGSISKSAEQKPTESASPFQSSNLFGGANKSTGGVSEAKPTTSSLFGNNTQSSASNLFGSSTTPAKTTPGHDKPQDDDRPAKRPMFGGDSDSRPSSAASIFGAKPATPEGENKENKPAETTSLFGSTKAAATPGFSFGSKAPAASAFTFGSTATEADESKPAGTPADDSKDPQQAEPKPLFGTTASTPSATFSFGSTATIPDQPRPASNPFGTTGSTPSFTFGQSVATPAKKPEENVSSKPSLFGSTTPAGPPTGSSSMFNFGQANNASTTATPASQPPSFAFGAQQPAATPSTQPNPAPAQNNMFSFNATQAGPPSNSSKPATGPGGRKIATPGGRFKKNVGSTPGSPGPSMFSQSQAPAVQNTATNGGSASFTFGQEQAPRVNTNSPASFTFGQNSSTTNGQSTPSNPFGSTQPSAPSSNLFGGASSGATPSSSFNFNFGQQAPATPQRPVENKPLFGAVTNGNSAAPSFSFTGATPTKSENNGGSNLFAPKPQSAAPLFSGLAPTGSGATSPFPVSSLNTTPVNGGTPEPQAQDEKKEDAADGEEKPDEQLSLTQGGPGEEDEEVLHEVRAKALKYVPADKDEPAARKSPFATMGLGPLRVLKNKSSGHVRLLLRAEPSGKVALNVSLISQMDYTQNLKTVSFLAASTEAGKLDKWVLQVKTEDSAKALAALLEEHKVANK